MKKIMIVLIVLVYGNCCFAFDSTPYILPSFEDGFTKTFRDEDGTFVKTKVDSGFTNINGVQVKSATSYVGGYPIVRAFYRWEKDVGFYSVATDLIDLYIQNYGYADIRTSFSPPILEIPKNISIGHTHTYSGTAIVTDFWDDVSTPVKATATIVGKEMVTTPAGTFNAIKIKYNIEFTQLPDLNQSYYQWVAPYLGIVKTDSRGELVSYSPKLEDTAMYKNVYDFVNQFYAGVLGRQGDVGGLEYWTDALISLIITGEDLAVGFVFSQEYMDKNTTDAEFVTMLYSSFNRAPDSGGYAHWISKLQAGSDRIDVLNGFVGSIEFQNLCEAYGIMPHGRAN